MGLSNAANKARNYTQTSNQNQGGGSKKAGFPHLIGRDSWTSVILQSTSPADGKCCKLSNTQEMLFPLTCAARPIGRSTSTYWNCKR